MDREAGFDADLTREETRADILAAFGLKPWQVGLAPLPWRVRLRAPFKRLWFTLSRRG